jgi:hypothetical protein
MTKLRDLGVGRLCVLEHLDVNHECIAVDPAEGLVVHLLTKAIVRYSPDATITALGEPLEDFIGRLSIVSSVIDGIIWRAIDG